MKEWKNKRKLPKLGESTKQSRERHYITMSLQSTWYVLSMWNKAKQKQQCFSEHPSEEHSEVGEGNGCLHSQRGSWHNRHVGAGPGDAL